MNRSTFSSGPQNWRVFMLRRAQLNTRSQVQYSVYVLPLGNFILVKCRKQFAIIAVVGNVDVKIEIDKGDVSEYTLEQRRQSQYPGGGGGETPKYN